MDLKIHLLYFRNVVILRKLIQEDAPYNEILKQSQLLDKYIAMEMEHINQKEVGCS